MRACAFLDRDNTIIANDGDLGDPASVRLLPGAAWGIRALREAGYCIAVVTNQGGVARGKYSVADVEKTNARIEELLVHAAQWSQSGPLIEGWYFCPYHPEGTVAEFRCEHHWRKPSPGMLIAAAKDLDLDLRASWMIGDSERDIAAGIAAGCRTVRIHGKTTDTALACSSSADFVEVDLLHASRRILRADGRDGSPSWVATSRARLIARVGQLDDAGIRETMKSAALGLAEREGVALVELVVDTEAVEVELVGAEIVAIGFVAQLRRITSSWAASHGIGELWVSL